MGRNYAPGPPRSPDLVKMSIFTDDGWQYIIERSEMNTRARNGTPLIKGFGVIIRLKQSDRADIFTRDVKLIIKRPNTCYGVFNYQIESTGLALPIL